MSDVAKVVLEERLRNSRVKDLVSDLCLRRPCVRGDYRLLQYYFLRDYCGIRISLATFDDLRRAPSPETISRRFRELCNEEPSVYCASVGTEAKRRKNERVWREYYANKGRLNEWL